MLSYNENQKSLSRLGSDRYQDVTDETTCGQTDRITVANTRYSYARKTFQKKMEKTLKSTKNLAQIKPFENVE